MITLEQVPVAEAEKIVKNFFASVRAQGLSVEVEIEQGTNPVGDDLVTNGQNSLTLRTSP